MDNWELYCRRHKGKDGNAKTGVPPLAFVSNGENLVDYRIYGATGGVGDIKNLFDKNSESASGYINDSGVLVPSPSGYLITTYDYIPVIPSTNYSYKAFNGSGTIRISYYTSGKVFISRQFTQNSGTTNKTVYVPSNCRYVRLSIDDTLSQTVLVKGNSSLSTYEPYGYKIPIVCGGTTTNIYLDEPLGENESISMNDTGVSIPTVEGKNTLSIGTTVQPSKVYIKYGGSSNVSQSLMRYLEYKYDFSKE